MLEDGTELPADLVVYATGYGSMNGWAADLIDQEVADKVGKVWGLGSDTTKDPGPWEGEQRNMWKPTQQEALWFHGGNLHQSRHYSLYLALQLKARGRGHRHPGLRAPGGAPHVLTRRVVRRWRRQATQALTASLRGRGGAVDDRREVGAAGEGAERAAVLRAEPGGAERVRDRGRRVLHEQRALQAGGHLAGQPPGADLERRGVGQRLEHRRRSPGPGAGPRRGPGRPRRSRRSAPRARGTAPAARRAR